MLVTKSCRLEHALPSRAVRAGHHSRDGEARLQMLVGEAVAMRPEPPEAMSSSSARSIRRAAGDGRSRGTTQPIGDEWPPGQWLHGRLESHLTAQHACRQLRRDAPALHMVECGLVCTTVHGTAVDHRNIRRRFTRLCRLSGVPRVRIYDLRHTATSLMIDAGADLKAASEALGHTDPRITMKVYRHVRGDQRAQAIALLSDAITHADPPTELDQD